MGADVKFNISFKNFAYSPSKFSDTCHSRYLGHFV